jgi:Tfp pilus assembly protein PilN
VAVVREQRRQAAGAFAAVAGLGVILLAVWAQRQGAVSTERKKADDAEAQVSRLQAQKASLANVSSVQTDLQQRTGQVTQVLKTDVDWPTMFNDIAAVIPSDVWLASFQGAKGTAPAPGAPASPANAAVLGTVTIQGRGFDHTSTARWLLRIGDLKEFAGLWVSQSQSSGAGPNEVVSFTSQAALTNAALSKRLDFYTKGPTQ